MSASRTPEVTKTRWINAIHFNVSRSGGFVPFTPKAKKTFSNWIPENATIDAISFSF